MKAKGFPYCDITVYSIGINLLASLNLYPNTLGSICWLGSKWHRWQKHCSNSCVHIILVGSSPNYLTSCASEFHWVRTLHKTLLHMLPFNFTEHPLVLLILDKIKWNTVVARLLTGTIIKTHFKKVPLLCQVVIELRIFQLAKSIISISKEKHLAKYLLSDLFTVYYFNLHKLLLAKLPGIFFPHCIVNTAFLAFQKHSTIETLGPASAPNEVNGKTPTDFIRS